MNGLHGLIGLIGLNGLIGLKRIEGGDIFSLFIVLLLKFYNYVERRMD